MKKKLFLTLTLLAISSTSIAVAIDPNETLLPEPFMVYTNGATVINHPEPGFAEKQLPTINLYKGSPGCYVACYSHQAENAIYPVGDDVYMLGQVRVAGKYNGRICVPTTYEGKDISADAIFKTICAKQIPSCTGSHCWAGGDTGGWFGIQ